MNARALYTQKEACEILRISRATLGDWSKKGIVKKISVPGQRRTYITGESVSNLITQK